jgi:type II secretory pathway component PulF
MESIVDFVQALLAILLVLMWTVFLTGPLLGSLWLGYYLISLGMRRQERARFVLDVIESGLKHGHRVEDTIISISESRDGSMGVHFHLLAFYLKDGLSLSEALEKVPRLLPPQISAMLRAGLRIGDLAKVLPACRQLSRDAISRTRGAINYLALFVFIGFPINLLIFSMLQIWVFPQFMAVCWEMGVESTGMMFLTDYKNEIMGVQVLLFLIVWAMTFIYVDGPRTFSWMEKLFAPLTHRLAYVLPWRRKRLQRDFATMLAVLIDAGMPEPEAVTLAADCTANKIFRENAQRAVAGLQSGLTLPDAVQLVDDAAEFRWRLTQAMHAHGGFFKAIAGWNESLDAKAFQQEQATAQAFTTGIVLLNGLLVGFIVVSAFSVLVSIINGGLLW